MEVNKTIEVRVDHGKEDVQEPGCGKFSDQHGDPKCGRTPPVMMLTLFLNPIPRQKKNKCYIQDRKRKATDTEKERRKQVKYRKTNDNSQKARSDYARHDGGKGVKDTVKDVPQEYLK